MFDAGGIRIGYMLGSASMLVTGAETNGEVELIEKFQPVDLVVGE